MTRSDHATTNNTTSETDAHATPQSRTPTDAVGNAADELITAGVLEPTETGLVPSAAFRAAVDEQSAAIDAGRVDVPSDLEGSRAAEDPDLCASYAVLRERCPDVSSTQALVTSVLLGSSDADRASESGTPAGFVPVSGADAVRLVDGCERCVVYVWRDDCPPCESIRSNLSEVFGSDPPAGVLALSVYGPDAAALLQTEYDVVGGPTTLFTLDGSVDTRFVGVAEATAIEREIETLRDRTPS